MREIEMSKIKVEQISDEKKKGLLIPDIPLGGGPWSVWECEPSVFEWHYDSTEKAYVYTGKVVITTAEEEVEIKAGDFVEFPAALDRK